MRVQKNQGMVPVVARVDERGQVPGLVPEPVLALRRVRRWDRALRQELELALVQMTSVG